MSVSLSAHPVTVSVPVLQHATVSSPHLGGQSEQRHTQMHSTIGPPPLISVTKQNVNPFYLKKLTGNIRVCQGCRGSLRVVDGSIQTSHTILLWHAWRRGNFGNQVEPSRLRQELLLPITMLDYDPSFSFIASSLAIPADIVAILTPQHRELLRLEFGLQICTPY